jgi:hypothetical protein
MDAMRIGTTGATGSPDTEEVRIGRRTATALGWPAAVAVRSGGVKFRRQAVAVAVDLLQSPCGNLAPDTTNTGGRHARTA